MGLTDWFVFFYVYLAPKIPPVPANASFAKMAAKSPPPEPAPQAQEELPLEEKEATEPSKPLSIYDEDKFPSLESSSQDLKSSIASTNTSSSSPLKNSGKNHVMCMCGIISMC